MAYKVKKSKRNSSFSDLTGNIVAYEEGRLSEPQTIKLFQHLENTGLAYQLQGMYGRMATSLIGAGLIKPNPRYHSEDDVKRLKQRNEINRAFSDL